jgi:hypothetical protein
MMLLESKSNLFSPEDRIMNYVSFLVFIGVELNTLFIDSG